MFILYTTEGMLYHICQEANSNSVCKTWYQIITKTKQVAIDKDEYDVTNEWVQQLHRMGVKIYSEKEWLDRVREDNRSILEEPTAAYILDIPESEAQFLNKEYGVWCQSILKDLESPIFIEPDWYIETSDETKEKNWNALLSGLSVPTNTIILLDRYLFSSESGENIEDSFTNIKQILNLLLPKKVAGNILDVSIIFDFEKINFKKDKKPDGTDITMAYLAKRINKLKGEIKREYPYNISLISISRNCPEYDKTHNRRILSNYYLVTADHKLKAYRENKALCEQNLTFLYIFSKGLVNPRSSMPEVTRHNTIGYIKKILEAEKKAKKSEVIIYRNGKEISISEYSNTLLQV